MRSHMVMVFSNYLDRQKETIHYEEFQFKTLLTFAKKNKQIDRKMYFGFTDYKLRSLKSTAQEK